MSLTKYRQKRNFKQTPEPTGTSSPNSVSSLYVIQKHAASHLHYDFRLEMDGVLKSWAVPKGPCLDPTVKRLAVEVEDHPIAYGSFEGIIPKGQYGAGAVLLWDKGTWESETSTKIGYQKGHLNFILKGKKLKGSWSLIRIKGQAKNWLLIKDKDEKATPLTEYDILKKSPLSVLSKQSIDKIKLAIDKKITAPKKFSKIKTPIIEAAEIKKLKGSKKSAFPSIVSPQLATLADKVPRGNQWLHEIKYDGYRIVSLIQKTKIKLMTRNQNDWANKFKELTREIKQLNLVNVVLDGEIVALDKNYHSNFQLLQNFIHDKIAASLHYYVFDLLYYNGYDLMQVTLLERKKLLKKLLPANNESRIHYCDHIIGKEKIIFNEICKQGLEGLISKNIESPYVQKRTLQWLKNKCSKRQEFLVCGYSLPQGQRKFFGALLLGICKDNKIIYCGRVGTGFNQFSLETLYKLLQRYRTATMPFEQRPARDGEVTWVTPSIIVEIEFSQWTRDGHLRHPSFKGIRQDKLPKQVNIEVPHPISNLTANRNTVQIKKAIYPFTHPQRILYPQQRITKEELGEFYFRISKWILPHIIYRPLTLVRCPQGSNKKCFYQKHLTDSLPKDVYAIDIKEKVKTEKYIYIKNLKGLLGLVQMGALEIHPWGCHIDNVEKPDLIVFDLDPGPKIKWEKVVEAAHFIKDQLLNFQLKSFVKTSGSKGLHIMVPLQRRLDWTETKLFAHGFSNYIVNQNPKEYLTRMNKSERVNKIYIDYLRNQRGATTVGVYSTRAKTLATVSTPIAWKELTPALKSDSFDIHSVSARLDKLKKDPWKEYFEVRQTIPKEFFNLVFSHNSEVD